MNCHPHFRVRLINVSPRRSLENRDHEDEDEDEDDDEDHEDHKDVRHHRSKFHVIPSFLLKAT